MTYPSMDEDSVLAPDNVYVHVALKPHGLVDHMPSIHSSKSLILLFLAIILVTITTVIGSLLPLGARFITIGYTIGLNG